MARGEISFADFLCAVHTLQADEEAAALIVTMLGLEQTLTHFGKRKPGAYEPRPSDTSVPLPPPVAAMPPTVQDLTDELKPEPDVLVSSLSEGQGITSSSAPPEWVSDTSVEAMRPASARTLAQAVIFDPLFDRQRQRAILSASLATQTHEGDIDVERLAVMRSELTAITRVPRLLSKTLRRGVQVLVDDSIGFTPYAYDREQLSKDISDVVGTYRVAIYRFRGSPERGVFRLRRMKEKWTPPHPGTVVALISDLGLGGPPLSADRAGLTEWIAVVEKARHAGCPVIVFNPLPPKKWPVELARLAIIVQWDRTTTIRSIRRALPKSHLPCG